MNKKEGKPKYFHPSKKHFLYCLDKQILSFFFSLCSKRFYVSLVLTWEEQCCEHARQRVTHTTTDPAAHHAVITVCRSSPYSLAACLWQHTLQGTKKHVSYSTNLYAYFTIYFYYHFNKYKTTLWFKKN